MKKEWFLWNALKKPELVIRDERMEQIERKSYYWCYRTLIRMLVFILVLWPSILSLSETYLGKNPVQKVFLQLLIFSVISVIETGRFLYSCYYGNQEFYEHGKGTGKGNFLASSLFMGVYAWLIFWISYGAGHPLPWVMGALGIILFAIICHLSYLHYAWLTEEATEEKGRKSEKWIPPVCIIILTLYYIIIFLIGFRNQVPPTLTEKDWQMIQEVQRGIDNYQNLANYKIDYSFETDIESEEPDIPHANYLVSDGECYTQLLDPKNKNTVYREYYRKDPETLEWYMADQGKWISEQEWRQSQNEEWATDIIDQPFQITQPICGLRDISPKTIAAITKENQNGNTCYTIIYNNKYNGISGSLNKKEIKQASITERYTINEYGTLIKYDHTETGNLKATGESRTMRRSFTILSANKETIQSELQSLKNQYIAAKAPNTPENL